MQVLREPRSIHRHCHAIPPCRVHLYPVPGHRMPPPALPVPPLTLSAPPWHVPLALHGRFPGTKLTHAAPQSSSPVPVARSLRVAVRVFGECIYSAWLPSAPARHAAAPASLCRPPCLAGPSSGLLSRCCFSLKKVAEAADSRMLSEGQGPGTSGRAGSVLKSRWALGSGLCSGLCHVPGSASPQARPSVG